MLGKYQLNFLESDLRELFRRQTYEMQRKKNYLSGGILFVLQTVLFIRMQYFEKSFEVVVFSLMLSILTIVLNQHAQNIANALIFLQFVLLNVQFATSSYSRYLNSISTQDTEIFIIGLGYGNLNLIVLQTFEKWYIKSLGMVISCALAFLWSNVSLVEQLSYLTPLYLTGISAIAVFYFTERFDKENFCLLFLQNKSLLNWQRIIKENIPQSMVFVTRPKKKCSEDKRSVMLAAIGSQQLGELDRERQSSVAGALSSEDGSTTSSSNNGLVFNFVNKKFYDQFKIKDWVEKQKNTLNEGKHPTKPSITEMLIKGEEFKGSMTCAESPLHQILFNNIFKNIFVSTSETGKSFLDIDQSLGDHNDSKSQETMLSLSEYLKSFIDEQKWSNDREEEQNELGEQIHHTHEEHTNNNCSLPIQSTLRDHNRTTGLIQPSVVSLKPKSAYVYTDPVKALNCFYKPSQPSFVLGDDCESLRNSRRVCGGGGTFAILTTESDSLLRKAMKNKVLQSSTAAKESSLYDKLRTDRDTMREETQGAFQTEQNQSPHFLPTRRDETARQQQGQSFIEIEFERDGNFGSERIVSDDNVAFESAKQPHAKQRKLVLASVCERSKQHLDAPASAATATATTSAIPFNSVKRLSSSKIVTSHNILDKHSSTSKLQQQQGFLQRLSTKVDKPETQRSFKPPSNVVQTPLLTPNADTCDTSSSFPSEPLFFDTQMVSCVWGEEEGVLLIFNDVSLRIVNEKLREIEKFKDTMLSTVTHDLKTPLNSIIMILENSIEQKGGLTKKQRQIILQNSQMLMSLINDILDYSQLQRDKFRLIIEEFSVEKCVLDVVDMFEIQAEQKRVKLTAEFKGLLHEYLMQDERRLKQILVNLIGNALKFTQQEGSIHVVVKQKEPSCIQIAVKDTGTGISESIQKKLFQFFNTFDHSERANNRHGIGLGLAICKQLNSQLGPWREIKLKSNVDVGSKFTFCIYSNLVDNQNSEGLNQGVNKLIQVSSMQQSQSQQLSARLDKIALPRQNKTSESLPFSKLSVFHSQTLEQNEKIFQFKSILNDQLTLQSHKNIKVTQPITTKLTTPNISRKTSLMKEEVGTTNNRNLSIYAAGSPTVQSAKNSPATGVFSSLALEHSKDMSSLMYMKPPMGQKLKSEGFTMQSASSVNISGRDIFDRNERSKKYTRANTFLMHGDKSSASSYGKKGVGKRSTFIKAQTMQNSKLKPGHSMIFPSYSPSAPVPKMNFTSQELQGHTEALTSSIAHKLTQTFVSQQLLSKSRTPDISESKIGGMSQLQNSTGKRIFFPPSSSRTQKASPNLLNIIESVALTDYELQQTPKDSLKKKGKCLPKGNALFSDKMKQAEDNGYSSEPGSCMSSYEQTDSRYHYHIQSKENDVVSENFREIEEFNKRRKAHALTELQHQSVRGGFAGKSHEIQPLTNTRGLVDVLEGLSNSSYIFGKIGDREKQKVQDSNAMQVGEDNEFPQGQSGKQDQLDNGNDEREFKELDSEEYDEKNHTKQNQEEPEGSGDDDDENKNGEDSQEDAECLEQEPIPVRSVNRAENERKMQSEVFKSLLEDYQRVMIADDSPFNIFCLKQILSKNANLDITTAFNGSEALSSFKQHRQQIIFMDLNMPILDGYECMKCIREYESQQGWLIDKTKIIIVSAQEFESFFCNFDGFISKPIKLIDMINLFSHFKEQLNLQQQQQQHQHTSSHII